MFELAKNENNEEWCAVIDAVNYIQKHCNTLAHCKITLENPTSRMTYDSQKEILVKTCNVLLKLQSIKKIVHV